MNARRTLIGLAIIGLVGAAAFPFAIYYIGLALAPPLPVASPSPVAPLLADAIWSRANGGHAGALTPLTPVSMGKFAACVAFEDFMDDTPGDARRVEACRHHVPGLQGAEYLSNVHMRDSQNAQGFRAGLGRLSTTIWLTHAMSRDEFVRTLAARAEFSAGVRGVDTAAQLFYGRPAAELQLPHAALIAALIGDRRINPWCDPAAAAAMRRRILERMRDDGVIDAAAYQSANAAELGLAPQPPDRQSCGG